MSDEFSRIARIREQLERASPGAAAPAGASGVELGVGDDAAVLCPSARRLVVSVDACVEGVHFLRRFASLEVLGARAMMAAASDLAAMGAEPRWALCAIELPTSASDADLEAMMRGLDEAARRLGMAIVGGNLTEAPMIGLALTVIGELNEPALQRKGARIGEGIYVRGAPGSAGLGLQLLLVGGELAPDELPFARAWLEPVAEIEIGRALLGVASAAIDTSDGLVQDLEHILEASGVGAELEVAKIPRAEGFEGVCARRGLDATQLALTGGEDYRVLFVAPPGPSADALGTRVGTIVAGAEAALIGPRGERLILGPRGHQHFSSAGD